MNEELIKQITELANAAKAAGETNAAIVLYALAGAMYSGDDYHLAGNVQNFVRDFLRPRAEENRQATNN